MIKTILLVCLLAISQSAFAEIEDNLLAQLNALPGVVATESTTHADSLNEVRRFSLTIEQPIDHDHPKAGKFLQKLVLFHRGYNEPMVLQTSGYAIFGEKLTRLASTFGANQIQVEHRFFGTSVPEKLDWSKLTVRQSAEDFHHIVEIFKKKYSGRWVNTGASKGGMTSIFHRRYFPGDLDGTVADVAPFSYALDDSRYVGFVDAVGGAEYADCRERLYGLQQTLLRRSGEILSEIEGSYQEIDKLVAYESAVVEMPFVFWQYGDPASSQWGCSAVPAPTASAHELANFLTAANAPSGYGDSGLATFQPYFFQAALELGAPGARLSHLNGLLKYPYVLAPFLPKNVKVSYSNKSMIDMRDWASHEAKGLLFVYGEFDPWSAGTFPALNSSDNHLFVVPRGNHSSNFTLLEGAPRDEAMATMSRWFNKAAVSPKTVEGFQKIEADDSLEALELRAIRKAGLR